LTETALKGLSVGAATAGWGKTTLLAEWARLTRDRQPVAWLTLDETDDEPQRFWSYVVSTLLTERTTRT
jgi:LuxR family transcriptional regulator, maltose regulon positive regulatory protein